MLLCNISSNYLSFCQNASRQLSKNTETEDELEEAPMGHCGMHLADLASGLALSLVQHKENKKVVNNWVFFKTSISS